MIKQNEFMNIIQKTYFHFPSSASSWANLVFLSLCQQICSMRWVHPSRHLSATFYSHGWYLFNHFATESRVQHFKQTGLGGSTWGCLVQLQFWDSRSAPPLPAFMWARGLEFRFFQLCVWCSASFCNLPFFFTVFSLSYLTLFICKSHFKLITHFNLP